MHTIAVIAAGLALLGALAGVFRWSGHDGHAARHRAGRIFLPLWPFLTLLNLWVGVARAGYTVAEEIPIQIVVLLVPATVAVLTGLVRRDTP